MKRLIIIILLCNILLQLSCSKKNYYTVGIPDNRPFSYHGYENIPIATIPNTEDNREEFIKNTFTRFLLVDLIKRDIKKSKNFQFLSRENIGDEIYYRFLFNVFPPPACLLRMKIKEVTFPDFDSLVPKLDTSRYKSSVDSAKFYYYLISVDKEDHNEGDFDLKYECISNFNMITTPEQYSNKKYRYQAYSPKINLFSKKPLKQKSLNAPMKTENYLVVLYFWHRSSNIATDVDNPGSLFDRFYILSNETGYYDMGKKALHERLISRYAMDKEKCKELYEEYKKREKPARQLSEQTFAYNYCYEKAYSKGKPETYIPYLNIILYSDYLAENFQFLKSNKKYLFFEFYSKTYEKKATIKVDAEEPYLFNIKLQ
jgi:hypothetical protein